MKGACRLSPKACTEGARALKRFANGLFCILLEIDKSNEVNVYDSKFKRMAGLARRRLARNAFKELLHTV